MSSQLSKSSYVFWIFLATFNCGLAVIAGELPLVVKEPSGVQRSGWPVTSGVPFHKGDFRDASLSALFDQGGKELPLQTEVLSRWPDGSIRWLLLDFPADLAANEAARYSFHYGSQIKRASVQNPLAVSKKRDQIEIKNGPLRIVLNSKRFRLLDAVWMDSNKDGLFSDDERVTSPNGAGVELTTPDGKRFQADFSRAKFKIEQSGPLRACVRIEGQHASKEGVMFGYIVRLHVFRGLPWVKLHYTFINNHPTEFMSKIDSLELAFATPAEKGSSFVMDGKQSGSARLFQVDDRRYEIDGNPTGTRANGWAAIAGKNGGLAVGVREFWQNWPKSLEVGPAKSNSNSVLRVGICPQFESGRYDGKPIKEEAKLYYYLRDGEYSFKVGMSRTHELWATFFDGAPNTQRLSHFFKAAEKPLLAQAKPEYVGETAAIGKFPASSQKRFLRYDLFLDTLFQLHLEDLDTVREYGLMNVGDWYNIKWDSWGNLEYDTARCFFVQYLRSGDRRYFERASQAARHFLDVDVCHATNDALRGYAGTKTMRPGHVWLHQVGHTGGYYGRYTGEKYVDEAPLIMKGAYQVGFFNYGHQWIGGVFDYYLLTGDRRALEVATMTADTIAADCPTRYTDHIRDLGWPLNLVINAYEATGEKRFLDAATRQWHLLKKHLDPKRGWHILMAYGHCSAESVSERCRGHCAYMLGLTMSGLARYHRITGDPEALVGLSAGVEQLVRECWSEKHKSFYLTTCKHMKHNPPPALCSVTALASEAFAYESAVTGNKEHRRILREAFRTMVDAGLQSLAKGEQHGQTGYASMMFHFTPHALSALEESVEQSARKLKTVSKTPAGTR